MTRVAAVLRRRNLLLTLGVGAVSLAWPSRVWAGSYLDRAALLFFSANTEIDLLRRRLYDAEVARLVHQQAEARVRSASSMLVPPEVAQPHPHLLLMLENCERAASSAVERKPEEFLKFLGLARDEEQLFRAILKQLGWELPRIQ